MKQDKCRKYVAKKIVFILFPGMIMGSFIACWFPFFLLYSISPVCSVCEDNNER